MIQNNMTQQLDTLLHDIELESGRRGLLQAKIISARPVPEKPLAELASMLRREIGSRHIRFNKVIDPELIGGIHVNAAGSELDLSVRGKLTRLTEGAN